jgi:hypothetical protein
MRRRVLYLQLQRRSLAIIVTGTFVVRISGEWLVASCAGAKERDRLAGTLVRRMLPLHSPVGDYGVVVAKHCLAVEEP